MSYNLNEALEWNGFGLGFDSSRLYGSLSVLDTRISISPTWKVVSFLKERGVIGLIFWDRDSLAGFDVYTTAYVGGALELFLITLRCGNDTPPTRNSRSPSGRWFGFTYQGCPFTTFTWRILAISDRFPRELRPNGEGEQTIVYGYNRYKIYF